MIWNIFHNEFVRLVCFLSPFTYQDFFVLQLDILSIISLAIPRVDMGY